MNNEILLKCFPKLLTKEVLSVLEKLNLKSEIEHYRSFFVVSRGEVLEIPQRIYFEKPSICLDQNESLIFNCLFTRHHNGFVREKSLRTIISKDEYWIAPFVVQLLGEYVIEIIEVVEQNINPKLIKNICDFVSENPKFYDLTKRRVTSYWNCYYRFSFPNKKDYAGYKILDLMENHLLKIV